MVTAVEVEARRQLLRYMAPAGRKLSYRDKVPANLINVASQIFDLRPVAGISLSDFVGIVRTLGPTQRKKRIDHFVSGERVVRANTYPPRKPTKPAEPRVDMSDEIKLRNFYESWEWKRLSYDIKLERGRRCECCGARAPQVRIHTDHIKPVRKYWHLRLRRDNLQVLCEDCNLGKGSRDMSDFRC